jgi:BASS family bile acid:Na+ symporter
MNKLASLIRKWMLPAAIVLGISLYMMYHFWPALHPYGKWLHLAASEGQRLVIATLLFFQFVKISPHDLKLRSWHFKALGIQVGSFLLLALVVYLLEPGPVRMLVECTMLCMICPTASAAGVITDRLGGNLASTVTYLVMINVAGTFLIPLVIPLVNPSAQMGFWNYVGHIALKVFPVLILPGILAWVIRYTTHKLQRALMRWASNSFYIWGIGLTLAMVLSTRALLLSGMGLWSVAGIVVVSVIACFFQFWAGHRSDKDRVANLTAGQALGQKNTGFLIWLGYNYMTPVTSVAGGLYAIWQNLYNSWELYQKERGKL